MKWVRFFLIGLFLSCGGQSDQGVVETQSSFFTAHSSKLWDPGQIINIAFLDGTERQIERVKSVSTLWLKYANLKFRFVSPQGRSHIRVTFKHDGFGRGWSRIGRQRSKKSEAATMSLRDTEMASGRDLILHEFGHALGLNHEHLNPHESGLKVQPKKIQSFCEEDRQMSYEKCLSNYFLKKTKNDLNSFYDKYSIMNYNIEEGLLRKDSPAPTGLEGELSLFDKMAMVKMYPGKMTLNEVILSHYETVEKSPFFGGSCGLLKRGDRLNQKETFDRCASGKFGLGIVTPIGNILPIEESGCFQSADEARLQAFKVRFCRVEKNEFSLKVKKVTTPQKAIQKMVKLASRLKDSLKVDTLWDSCLMETQEMKVIVNNCRGGGVQSLQIKMNDSSKTFYSFTFSNKGKINILYNLIYDDKGLHCELDYDDPQFRCFNFQSKDWIKEALRFDQGTEEAQLKNFLTSF